MMKNIYIRTAFLICVLLVAASPALALRCGNNIVDVGDTKIEVLSKCGEPTV